MPKETYKQLLQQQENIFKCFVQILVDSTNKRMDALTREGQDLKNSLQFSKGQLDELKQENGKMTAICKTLREDISSVCEFMITMTDKSDHLEGQSRWNNMIVDRIAESPHETWTESEDKVREMITEILEMDHKKIEVEHAHRTRKPTTSPGDRLNADSGQVPEVQGQDSCSGKSQELVRNVYLPQQGLS